MPEAEIDKDRLEDVRRSQYQDEQLLDLYDIRIRWVSNAGTAPTLAGLACALAAMHKTSTGALVGAGFAAAAAVLTLLRWSGRRLLWIYPRPLTDFDRRGWTLWRYLKKYKRLDTPRWRPPALDELGAKAMLESPERPGLAASLPGLAALMDRGLVTPEEFQLAKRQALGLDVPSESDLWKYLQSRIVAWSRARNNRSCRRTES